MALNRENHHHHERFIVSEWYIVAAPIAALRESFKSTQRHIEAELKQCVSHIQRLKALATSEASTRAQVARELREMETNLQKLRRDLIAARAADADVTQSVLRRAEFASKHENASELSNADVQVILDRLVVDFLLRIGHADAARRLAEQAGVAALCDFALFDEMHAVLGALRSRNCAPALQWCAEHHSQLSKLPAEVDVEFELRAQMFLGLLRAGQRADALQYARKWFPAHAERHLPALQRTMACLAFDPDTQHPRYRPLFDEAARFAELSRRFVRAALALAGAPAAAPLLVYTIAALATLKTTACTIDSDRVDACPVCTEPLRELAANVPVALRQQSFLLCRMSGAVMGDDNPPLALPNGNVYSTSALTEQAAMNDGNMESQTQTPARRERMTAPLSIVHSRTHEFTDIAESLVRNRRNGNGARSTTTTTTPTSSAFAPQGVETHLTATLAQQQSFASTTQTTTTKRVAVSNPHSANFISTACACDAAVRESRASLARLERLIGRAQLFANAAEVEAHVAALRSALAQHQAAVDRCDELGDAAERRAANAQARAHISAVRGELRRRVQRLAKRFTDVLQKHGDGQKRRRRAQMLLVGGDGAGVEDDTTVPPGSAASSSTAAASSSSASTAAATAATAASGGGGGGGGGEAGVRQRRRVPVASGGVDVPSGQSSVLLHVKDYGQQRRAAEQVEATIFELSGMMHRISHSVAEQQELFSRIDVTLEESESALARAQAQLLQFWDALQGDRGFAVKLLAAVLLVALIMFYFFR